MSNKAQNRVVKFAYAIESSRSYHRFRTFLFNILENDFSSHKKYFDYLIIFLVISTVGILIYEVKNEVDESLRYYEYFAICFFILEWLGRFFISFESHKQIIKDYEESQYLNIEFTLSLSLKTIVREKLRYVFSIASIIDLLAILPSYRPLRILRIFLLFRFFKVLRYSTSLHYFIKIFIEKKTELMLLFLLYILIVFFCATVLYVYEGGGLNKNIHSFFDAIYWSFITVATIGYGDITPLSDAGKVATFVLILTGYVVVGFFTAIITSSMFEKLELIKNTKILTGVSKSKRYILVCGFGKTGHILVENLLKNGHNVLIIDKNPVIYHNAEVKNINIIKDDATNIDLLENIGLHTNIHSVVVLTDDDAVNLSIILSIRSINKHLPIIAKCNRFKTKEKLTIAGANQLIFPNGLMAKIALGFIKHPVAYEAIDDILNDTQGAVINELEIYGTSFFVGAKLSQIDFGRFNLTFLGVSYTQEKTDFVFNPNKEEIILKEKIFIVVIGYEKTINEFKKYLQRGR